MAEAFESLVSLLGDDVSVRWLITLLHFLWQGSVVGGVVAIAGRLLRGASARSRYALYSAALLSLPVCVAVTFCVVDVPASLQSSSRLESPVDTPAESSALPSQPTAITAAVEMETAAVTDAPVLSEPVVTGAATMKAVAGDNSESLSYSSLAILSRAAPWIAAAYVVGVACFLLRLSTALWSGHRLRTSTARVTDAKLLKLIVEQADRVKLKCVPVVAYCERVAVPTVVGVLRPMVLLPMSLMTGLTPDDFAAIIRHELAHIRRYDLWMNLLQRVIESLLFFHPVVWFISRQLSAEREVCCDDLVVSSGYEPTHYAGALLRMAELCAISRQPGASALAATGDKTPLLERRIERLMNWGNTPRLQLTRVGMAGLLMTLVSLIVVPGIAHTWAQAQAPGGEPAAKSLAAEDATPAAPRTETAQKPKGGAKLAPGTVDKLRWGEPMNGLRAALSRLPSLGEPKAGQYYDFDLVVQNVSNAPIRLIANSAAPNPRRLFVRKKGVTLYSLVSKEPTQADFMLQPREVAVLRMFPPDEDRGKSIADDPDLAFCAEMEIERAPAGAWTGRLYVGETSGAVAAGKPLPKDESAQSLFRKWQDNARINGKIPGGALGSLAAAASNFVKHNPTDERAPKLAELLKRIDTSRDWTQADAVALLDDVTAIYANLPRWAEDLTRFSIAEVIRTGQPLPADLENAPWGEAQPDGLRAAWLLDPRAEQHRLGTPLKSRILFHNAGKNAVVFRALTWNQSGRHMARDAKGTVIKISSTEWTTIPQIFACRLAPGEYTEVIGAGIGVGANKDDEDWRGTRVGAWIEAKEGDEVTFTPAPVSGRDGRAGQLGENWWLVFVTDRLSRDMPLPDDAGERRRLLDRAMRDLFGTAPTPEETATFVADRMPDAMGALAKRLAQRAGTTLFTGTLQSGETKFRVLPVDPEAAKKPRVATGPGRYTLGDNVRLVIVRKPDGDRRVNEADIVFFSPDPKAEPPGQPHAIKLPDGYLTWAIAWERDSTVLWVAEKGVLCSYDFATPAQVKETRIEPARLTNVPEPLREALRPALEGGSNASAKPGRAPAAAAAKALP